MGEVLADMADLRWRQRVGELLSVARALPGLAGDPAVGAATAGLMDAWHSYEPRLAPLPSG